jgi:hypothetical protein
VSNRITCPGCKKSLAPTNNGKYRKHGDCDYGSTVIPEENECQPTPSPSPDGAQDPVPPATPSTPSSPNSPEPEGNASTASAPDALPGVEKYAESLNDLATQQLEAYKAKVEANITPFSQPAPLDPVVEEPTLFSQPAPFEFDNETAREFAGLPPASFSQPAGRKSEEPVPPMSAEGAQLAARLKELFGQYDRRRSSDNRSAQTTMGPSEMGYGCDRRIALKLLRQPPVNPGGDGFAAWVGTCIHAGLEDLFKWADGNTGRFATEERLEFDSPRVPKGTADLIDRSLMMLADHKALGRWSRNKFKKEGPPPHYRVQGHVYAHGARRRGEKIEKVAWFLWPRDEATLDDLYVWVEDYNPAIAQRAFERVESIGAQADMRASELRDVYPDAPDWEIGARVGLEFEIDPDSCRYCPFHLPGTRDPLRGCNGRS